MDIDQPKTPKQPTATSPGTGPTVRKVTPVKAPNIDSLVDIQANGIHASFRVLSWPAHTAAYDKLVNDYRRKAFFLFDDLKDTALGHSNCPITALHDFLGVGDVEPALRLAKTMEAMSTKLLNPAMGTELADKIHTKKKNLKAHITTAFRLANTPVQQMPDVDEERIMLYESEPYLTALYLASCFLLGKASQSTDRVTESSFQDITTAGLELQAFQDLPTLHKAELFSDEQRTIGDRTYRSVHDIVAAVKRQLGPMDANQWKTHLQEGSDS